MVTHQQQKADVVFINMPFAPLLPSIGLSLLKASIAPLNISTKVCYFTLRFAQQIGVSFYNEISDGKKTSICDLVGEWIFSGTLFDSTSADVENFVEDVLRGRSPAHKIAYPQIKPLPEDFIQDILHVRSLTDDFLNLCLEEILSYQPRFVAFTSTFHQHVAALSLAKRIKAQAPNVFIEFGGANCQGIMGLETIRQFPFIDAVISGEADRVFPELVRRVLEKQSIDDLQGIYIHDRINFAGNLWDFNAPAIHDMDALPFPDYDDYFLDWERLRPYVTDNYQTRLLFETSRGCWWGEKQHCTFCGLNGQEMAYRSKSATRAMDELLYLIDRYPGYPISAVDNILDMKYFKSLIPLIAERQLHLELFYEVKANLKKEQIRLLRDAGIKVIQPGIESLSSNILTIMRKGVKGLHNIQLLKWCKELGVTPVWNLLWGFPGESPDDYRWMAEIMPFLSHLQHPQLDAKIRIDRFSPNFDYPEQFGFEDVLPYPAYHYVYPLADESVANLAYFFTFNYSQPQDVESYIQPLREQVMVWQSVHSRSNLSFIDKETKLQIWDLRPVAKQLLVNLTEPQRTLYLACDGIRSLSSLKQVVIEQLNQDLSDVEIEEILQPLIEDGLMIREDHSFLSLATLFTE